MNVIAKHIAGRPGPNMALEITALFEWINSQPAFFLGLTGQVMFADRVVCDSVQFQRTFWNGSSNTLITRDSGGYQGKLIIPMRGEAIRYIEDRRHDQDVSLGVKLECVWQEAIETPRGDKGQTLLIGGRVYHNTTSVQDCLIKRSDWLKRLTEMGWQEYELFEVAKQPLLDDPNLTIALKRLDDAQASLRSGDYSGVLTKCRAALESAAKYEATGDVKEGFERLLARAFKGDDKKREMMNSVIKGISEYAHLGRHEQYPAIHIAREEAEFVFTVSVSLFSLLSRRISSAL